MPTLQDLLNPAIGGSIADVIKSMGSAQNPQYGVPANANYFSPEMLDALYPYSTGANLERERIAAQQQIAAAASAAQLAAAKIGASAQVQASAADAAARAAAARIAAQGGVDVARIGAAGGVDIARIGQMSQLQQLVPNLAFEMAKAAGSGKLYDKFATMGFLGGAGMQPSLNTGADFAQAIMSYINMVPQAQLSAGSGVGAIGGGVGAVGGGGVGGAESGVGLTKPTLASKYATDPRVLAWQAKNPFGKGGAAAVIAADAQAAAYRQRLADPARMAKAMGVTTYAEHGGSFRPALRPKYEAGRALGGARGLPKRQLPFDGKSGILVGENGPEVAYPGKNKLDIVPMNPLDRARPFLGGQAPWSGDGTTTPMDWWKSLRDAGSKQGTMATTSWGGIASRRAREAAARQAQWAKEWAGEAGPSNPTWKGGPADYDKWTYYPEADAGHSYGADLQKTYISPNGGTPYGNDLVRIDVNTGLPIRASAQTGGAFHDDPVHTVSGTTPTPRQPVGIAAPPPIAAAAPISEFDQTPLARILRGLQGPNPAFGPLAGSTQVGIPWLNIKPFDLPYKAARNFQRSDPYMRMDMMDIWKAAGIPYEVSAYSINQATPGYRQYQRPATTYN